MLVSPAPRSALVAGKALSAGLRALSHTLIVYLLAVLLDVGLNLHPAQVLGVAAFVMLGSALFSTLSLIIACIVKTRERFMGIGQVITMPISLVSNAIYRLSLKTVSHNNPLTYEVNALRECDMRYGLLFDLGVLATTTILLIAIASKMYARTAY